MKLELKNISKSFGGIPVLKELSISFENGVNVIMAPSGAGKTTLLRLLLGLEKPDSGELIIPAACRFSVCFQEDRLIESLNAAGNLRLALGREYDRSDAEALLGELGLDLSDDKPVRDYSGGMKRRLSLARALLKPHDVLVLDEAFNALDGENKAAAINSVLHRSKDKTVIAVTHSESEARLLNAKLYRI